MEGEHRETGVTNSGVLCGILGPGNSRVVGQFWSGMGRIEVSHAGILRGCGDFVFCAV